MNPLEPIRTYGCSNFIFNLVISNLYRKSDREKVFNAEQTTWDKKVD